MSIVLDSLYYTEEHEWVKVEGNQATIGITDHAQDELGDIVFLELPKVDEDFSSMDEIGVVESVKTVSNLYMPISGRIIEINDAVVEDPALVNSSPYDEGWILKIDMIEPAELDYLKMSEEYKEIISLSEDND